jgi:hypothetical protein
MTREYTLEGLDAFLAVMRKHGAIRFKTALDGSPLEVIFGESVTRDTTPLFPSAKDINNVDEASVCKCGHHDTEHAGDGVCLRGCPVEQCVVPGPELAP